MHTAVRAQGICKPQSLGQPFMSPDLTWPTVYVDVAHHFGTLAMTEREAHAMADRSIPAKQVAEWLAFIRRLRAELAAEIAERTITPEDTLANARADGSDRREALYQRRMSRLLAGRPWEP